MTATDIRHAPVDVAAARLITRMWDDREKSEYIVVTVPSRRDPAKRHLVKGHAHGRTATCSCWGFLRHKRCAHASAFMPILEELERQHYADQRRYTDEGLMALLDYYDSDPQPLNHVQRLRRNGVAAALAERGVDYRATRTLAEQAELVARGKRAARDLFEEG